MTLGRTLCNRLWMARRLLTHKKSSIARLSSCSLQPRGTPSPLSFPTKTTIGQRRAGSKWADSIRQKKQPRAVKSHTLWAFGDNSHAQCGAGSQHLGKSLLLPIEVEALSLCSPLISKLSCGWRHGFALEAKRPDGGRRRIWSWGFMDGNPVMQQVRATPYVANPETAENLKDMNIADVACGRGHTFVVTENKELYFAGSTDLGQSGTGVEGEGKTIVTPTKVESLGDRVVSQIYCGLDHVIAVLEDKSLVSWGYGNDGQLGHGEDEGELIPRRMEFFDGLKVHKIWCGYDSSFAQLDDGRVFAWGNNIYGQLGLGHRDSLMYPTEITALRDRGVVELSAGGTHVGALCDNGEVLIWGSNADGRLGMPSLKGKDNVVPTPQVLEELSDKGISMISCGGGHSLVGSRENNVVLSWGLGVTGRLGLGDQDNKTTPQPIFALVGKKPLMVKAGVDHSLVLTE